MKHLHILARQTNRVPFGDLLMDFGVCLFAAGQWLVLPAICVHCGRRAQAVRQVGNGFGCLGCTTRERA